MTTAVGNAPERAEGPLEAELRRAHPSTFGTDRHSARIIGGLLELLRDRTEVTGISSEIAPIKTKADLEVLAIALCKAHWLADQSRANGDMANTPPGRLLDVRLVPEVSADPDVIAVHPESNPAPAFIAHGLLPPAQGFPGTQPGQLRGTVDNQELWRYFGLHTQEEVGRLIIRRGTEAEAIIRGAVRNTGAHPAPAEATPGTQPEAPTKPETILHLDNKDASARPTITKVDLGDSVEIVSRITLPKDRSTPEARAEFERALVAAAVGRGAPPEETKEPPPALSPLPVLSAQAARIYKHLSGCAKTRAELVEDLDVSERGVGRALKELREQNLIAPRPGGGCYRPDAPPTI